MRPLIFGAALALMTLVTGCQTPHTFATPDASWKTHIGQLKHTSRERTVIGEVVVQKRGEEFQLDFLKGGSFPLISIREDATQVRAEGVLARGRWQGPWESSPKHLRNWFALREAFQLYAAPIPPPNNKAKPPANWHWTSSHQFHNGQLSLLSMTSTSDSQSFVFQFGR